MKYRIGQKVVYIGPDLQNHPFARANGVVCPMPNKVYTIRGGRDAPGFVGYLLEEIVNRVGRCAFTGVIGEMHISEPWLRPVTDISQFHEIRKAVERGVRLTFPEAIDL